MMMEKRKAPAPEVWNDEGTPKILLMIDGLREVDLGDGVRRFELSGVAQRPINWHALSIALGFADGELPERLADEIARAVLKHDLLEILAERARC